MKMEHGELLAAVRELVELTKKSVSLPAVLSLEEAGKQLGDVSPSTVKRMIARGEVRAVPVSGRMGIPRDEIERIARGEPSPKLASHPTRKAKQTEATTARERRLAVSKKF